MDISPRSNDTGVQFSFKMLEEHVAYYLEKYLGNYVKGLSKEALKISVWQGNVELTNMQLKPEALNALKLPIKVKAGFLGSVKLQVPWSRLGKEPVLVLLDRIFVLAEPETKVECGGDDASIQEARRRKIKEAELAILDARLSETHKSEVNNSWLGSLISTIIGNLKLSITNIHIRYEDSESNPGHPFAAGLTLEKLAAVTVDENGKETFITSGALDTIQKAGELQGLALYLDPDTKLWISEKPWDKLLPAEWNRIFEPGIKGQPHGNGSHEASFMPKCHYLLQPVRATARYTKQAFGDSRTEDKEVQKAALSLDDVTLSLSQAQYRDVLKLAENISAFRKRLQYAHYRPSSSPKVDAKSWWKYAYRVILEQLKKTSVRLSWKEILRYARLRQRYLPLYVKCLQSNPNSSTVDNNKEIEELECGLDDDVIIQWRMLAHTYVDKNRRNGNVKNQQSKGNWWWFSRGSQSPNDSGEAKSFTEDDWRQLNQIIGYEEGKESSVVPGQGPPHMLHTILEVQMRHNASKLVDDTGCNIIELSAEELQCNSKIYPEMKVFNLKLGSYQISSPEGLLAESEAHQNAISGDFTYKPLDKSVDWSLSARASPCYITYLNSTINEVVEFFQNRSAVSQTVAIETAAALQATLDEVARSAQQQLNQALKERPRFFLDLNIAAPKIIVPSDFYPDRVRQSKILLDFGYFTLQTEETNTSESHEEIELYMHFKLGLSDVQIFLIDGTFDWREHYNISSSSSEMVTSKEKSTILPVLERCGITMALQQICIPHPAYPSTRLAVRLPSLRFHFSPARYHRLMQILKVFQKSSNDTEKSIRPWDSADFEEGVSLLAWKGVGNREAVWQHRYAALAGPFLYILDSPSSASCRRHVSLIGKHVIPVPAESIGGVPNVLAICESGQFNNKVAESVNALLLRLDNEEARDNWQGRLQGAIYRSSAPAAVSGIFLSQEDKHDLDEADSDAAHANVLVNAADKENFFLTGALDELKIMISSSTPLGGNISNEQLLLAAEHPLLELRALGSKVEFLMRRFDMSVGAVLQALEIEDKFSSKGSSQQHYLACSDINASRTQKDSDDHAARRCYDVRRRKGKKVSNDRKESRDMFFDTEENLGEPENPQLSQSRHLSRSTSDFYDAEDFEPGGSLSPKDPPKFERIPGLLPDLEDHGKEGFSKNELQEDFVKAQVILFSLDSPAYKNVDKQIMVSLATLSFFCIRPTIMALLDFTSAVTADVTLSGQEPSPDKDGMVTSMDSAALNTQIDIKDTDASFDRKDSIIKGLLGSGKSRILLLVILNMRQTVIILKTEDGNQLATLSQEYLHSRIKVFPSSFGITASLGNLRITDDSLDYKHPYNYICDTRNPGSTSFVELEFYSFSEDDNDYEGYEYSLIGKLSEVRFVYLHRFIQELSAYFMGLVPQSSGYVVKIDNKVTNVEKFFTQSEVEGSPAIKLDVSLSKPIIVLPCETNSTDFLELDILHINVKNSLEWIGGEKDNPGAVRLDTTVLHVEDIHLAVGMHGKSGDGIIKKANGLSLSVIRPLRDLWHQIPGVDASIKIEELKADLSDKEYQVITQCASSNFSEKPNLPPPVALPKADKGQEQSEVRSKREHKAKNLNKLDVEREHENDSSLNREKEGSWTTMMVTATIDLVELRLFKGRTRDIPLASTQVSGVWVAYKVSSLQETVVLVSLETFSVKDDREGIEPELRYMIGKADDMDYSVSEQALYDKHPTRHATNYASIERTDCRSPLTMLVMDAKLTPVMQMVSLRIQQPRLLAAVDFLLALAEFFVPSIHNMVSDPKDLDEDHLDLDDGLYLDQAVYKQESKEATFSPKKPLIADNLSIDNYVYDGRGGYIRLLNEKGAELDSVPGEPLIFIGNGKTLRFRNVIIQNGDFLDSCIYLGIRSTYTISEADGVFLELLSENTMDEASHSENDPSDIEDSKGQNRLMKETMFDLQAIGPELIFYDSVSGHIMPQITERLIRAKMDVLSRFVLKGDDMQLDAKMNELSVVASSGLNVVEPVDMIVKYSGLSGKQSVQIDFSDIMTNFSFSVLQLIMRLQEDISLFLRITTKQVTVQCYQFDRIWTSETKSAQQHITFWRPHAPPGFAVLGDCITPSDKPLAKEVVAVNMSLSQVKRPVSFELVWSSGERQQSNAGGKCSVWMPVPPAGYVAFGCVVTQGTEPPPPSSVVCVWERIVTTCSMKDCIYVTGLKLDDLESRSAFWRVDNSAGSFFVVHDLNDSATMKAYELRHVTISQGFPRPQEKQPDEILAMSPSECMVEPHTGDSSTHVLSRSLATGPHCETVACFKLIWWNKSDTSNRKISIWRPILPPGCVFAGDLAVNGYEPPSLGLVLHDQHDGLLLRKPLFFEQMTQIKKQRATEGVSFWYPSAPPGYTAMGCIASQTDGLDPALAETVCCIRNDVVAQSQFASKIWDSASLKRADEVFSIWPVENELHTFIVQKGLESPPKRLAFSIADQKRASEPENFSVDAEVKNLSAVIYDDFQGFMVPLLNISLSDMNANLLGRMGSLCSTVNFSLAAMAYNGKYFSWEPLIEPFDGFVRHDSKSKSSERALGRTESQVRIVSTSIVNCNVSVAHLNMLLEAYTSWDKLSELMQGSKGISMDAQDRGHVKKPALELRHKKSFQVVHHNKLGEDLLIRMLDVNGEPKIVPLPAGHTASLELPTSTSIIDPRIDGNGKGSNVGVVAIRIGDAEIPHDGGFGGQKYMAIVRIFPQLRTSDQCPLEQQSARTRCVSVNSNIAHGMVLVHWDEVFSFEIEPKETKIVEILVTDLATGSPIGYCSFSLSAENNRQNSSIEHESDSRQKCTFEMKWEALMPPEGSRDRECNGYCGKISYGIFFFPLVIGKGKKPPKKGQDLALRPGMIQVSYKNQECWTDIGLNYAARATCWKLCHDNIATETIVEDGMKQLIFRSLAVVLNVTDFSVDVALSLSSESPSVLSANTGDSDRNLSKAISAIDGNTECSVSRSKTDVSSEHHNINPLDGMCATEEVFENERYQPLIGWGSTWLLPTDPKHWSRRDFSCSVQEFPEAELPLGWEWKDNWKVDKVGAADEDGWSYDFDFRNVEWPPSKNMKVPATFVRRRRWIRTRKCMNAGMNAGHTNPIMIGTLEPEKSIPFPIASLRPSSPDYSIQIRPHETNGSGSYVYRWSDVVLCTRQSESRRKQKSSAQVSLHSLSEAEELLCCSKEDISSSESARSLWFCLDVQAKEIGMNSQLDPMKDWRIVIVAPLILFNFLPVSSEYAVLEKSSGTGLIVRERGVIALGKEAQVFCADIRKALYLTLTPQGGWQPENAPVLISHPHKQSSKHILLKNFSTGRILRILVDQFPDGKQLVAKRIRFYVPCWLDVENCPPLHFKFVEIKQDKSRASSEPKFGKVLELISHDEIANPYTLLSTFNAEKMGVSVALAETDKACFEPPTPLHPLGQADGYIELRALDETESRYYKIFVSVKLCPFETVPTKVLVFRPYMTFTNRLGESVYLKQKDSDEQRTLKPSDWRAAFPLRVTEDPDILQVRIDSTEWSFPFPIKQEETLHIAMREDSFKRHHIRMEVRGYEEGSRFLVVFRKGSIQGPYRLENHMKHIKIQYRQSGLDDGAWQFLQPGSADLYAWENPCGEQLLEVLTVGDHISTSEKFDITRTGDHYPSEEDMSVSFYCQVLEIGDVKVVRFSQIGKRRSQTTHCEGQGASTRSASSSKSLPVEADGSSSQLEIQLELGQVGFSMIDLKPRELLYLYMEKLSFFYALGYVGKIRRIELLLDYLQLDNQLPLTVLPVLLVREERRSPQNPVLKFTIVISDEKSESTVVFPYIGVQVTRSPWRVNIHEPIIWAIMDFYNDLHLDKLSGGSDIAQVDPELRIDVIDISDVRLKLTLETAPSQRPKGVLGLWSPIVNTLGNIWKMHIHLRSVVQTNRYMRKSALVPVILDRLRRDLIHNPLMLLSGVDVLGMTSSTLATLSETVAELSSDGKFLQLRSKMDRARRIAGVTDGLMQGTEAIAQGFAFGVSGMIRNPVEKAKEHGVLGFIQGLGKAVLGIVVQPMSGVLDFVALTVNGVGASCTKCFEIFENEPSFERVRLPRAIRPDGVLCCYDEKAAVGQAILQLAEGKGRFRQGIFFREPSKFAWSDFYMDHFNVMDHKIVMATNKRVMLLQCPKSFKPERAHVEPCCILWDVPWEKLLALEMACTTHDHAPIYIVLHLRSTATIFAQLVKCSRTDYEDGFTHAKLILESISKSWKAYGPNRSSVVLQLAMKRQLRISTPSKLKQSLQSGLAPIDCLECTNNSLSGSSSQTGAKEMQYQQNGDTKETFNFEEIWSSEQVAGMHCSFCVDMVSSENDIITIWRPIVPEGYVSIGDIAHIGKHPPFVSRSYKNKKQLFSRPTGFDLVWRSWKEGFVNPVSIWMPRAPDGYFALGCVATAAYVEPEWESVWCVHSSIVEDAEFEEREIWHAPNNSPWGCFLYQIVSEALTFIALRKAQLRIEWKPKRVSSR